MIHGALVGSLFSLGDTRDDAAASWLAAVKSGANSYQREQIRVKRFKAIRC